MFLRSVAKNVNALLQDTTASTVSSIELPSKESLLHDLNTSLAAMDDDSVTKHSKNASYGSTNPSGINPREMEVQLNKLFDSMTKLCIVCGSMIITTQVVTVSILVFHVFETFFRCEPWYTQFEFYLIYWYYLVRSIDCVICSTCVFLSFTEHDTIYHKLCYCIHRCIKRCCISCI